MKINPIFFLVYQMEKINLSMLYGNNVSTYYPATTIVCLYNYMYVFASKVWKWYAFEQILIHEWDVFMNVNFQKVKLPYTSVLYVGICLPNLTLVNNNLGSIFEKMLGFSA